MSPTSDPIVQRHILAPSLLFEHRRLAHPGIHPKMTQYCPDSGNKCLNETRAWPLDLFRSVRSHDGRPRKAGPGHSKPPNRPAFLIAVIAINTLVAATAWFVVAAIRG